MYNSDKPSREELPTKRTLIKSTLLAMAIAGLLLITIVLPAEYAIDPTGIGRTLGLTEMGDIKQQLAEEVLADQTRTEQSEIEPQVITATDQAASTIIKRDTQTTDASTSSDGQWKDQVSVILAPGKTAEIKLAMKRGDTAVYEWRVDEGHLNSDLHADGETEADFVSYRKGRAETLVEDEFTAAFDGMHGWYWRNRSNTVVEVTLKTRGTYSEVKQLF